jgi:hypothetical protein
LAHLGHCIALDWHQGWDWGSPDQVQGCMGNNSSKHTEALKFPLHKQQILYNGRS